MVPAHIKEDHVAIIAIAVSLTPDQGANLLFEADDHGARNLLETLHSLSGLMPGEIAQRLSQSIREIDTLKSVTPEALAAALSVSMPPIDPDPPESQASRETVGNPKPNDNSLTTNGQV